jgi:hypothetical protein
MLLRVVDEGFFENRRLGQLVRTLLKKQLQRIMKAAEARGQSSPSRYEVTHVLNYTDLCASEDLDAEGLSLIHTALHVADDWKLDPHNDGTPDLEQAW